MQREKDDKNCIFCGDTAIPDVLCGDMADRITCFLCNDYLKGHILAVCFYELNTIDITNPVLTGDAFLLSEEYLSTLLDGSGFFETIKQKRLTFFPGKLAELLAWHGRNDETVWDVVLSGLDPGTVDTTTTDLLSFY